jgi:hypothetical protein
MIRDIGAELAELIFGFNGLERNQIENQHGTIGRNGTYRASVGSALVPYRFRCWFHSKLLIYIYKFRSSALTPCPTEVTS